jgi:hypothetical protein
VSGGVLPALPIISANTPGTVGLLFREGPVLFRLEGSKALGISTLGPDQRELEIGAAVAVNGTTLDLLLQPDPGVPTLTRVAPGRREVLRTLSGAPATLAVDRSGRALPLYLPVGIRAPTQADPLVVVDGERTILLAPWTTLAPAVSTVCHSAADDLRFTLQLTEGWLRVDLDDSRFWGQVRWPMLALLRGNEKRLCLEAVETLTNSLSSDSDDGLRVVARFAAPVASGLVAAGEGTEYRQTLRCELLP